MLIEPHHFHVDLATPALEIRAQSLIAKVSLTELARYLSNQVLDRIIAVSVQ
jgi:hypothetical protein